MGFVKGVKIKIGEGAAENLHAAGKGQQ